MTEAGSDGDGSAGVPGLLTGYAEVAAALRSPGTYTTVAAIDCGQRRPLLPLQVEPPLHGEVRGPLEPYFSAAAAAQRAPQVAQAVEALLAPLPRDEPVDLNAEFGRWVPVHGLLDLLGLPIVHAAEARRLHDLVLGFGGDATDDQRRGAADGVYAWFGAAFGDAAPGGLVAGLLALGQAPDQVADVCFTLLLAGIDPVSQAIAVGACLLGGGGAEGPVAGPDGLPVRALEELLRWGAPVDLLPRTLAAPAAGCPVGARAGLSIRLANRDPEVFADPDRFDPERHDGAHLSFGAGPHRCIGAHLARLQVKVALEHLQRTAPALRLAEPGAVGPAQDVRAHDRLLVVLGPSG